jgi:hypothetical protein
MKRWLGTQRAIKESQSHGERGETGTPVSVNAPEILPRFIVEANETGTAWGGRPSVCREPDRSPRRTHTIRPATHEAQAASPEVNESPPLGYTGDWDKQQRPIPTPFFGRFRFISILLRAEPLRLRLASGPPGRATDPPLGLSRTCWARKKRATPIILTYGSCS